jgi:bifunctional non-homologous end joining protein LigD
MPLSHPSPLGFIRPEIPTLVPAPPSREGWIHEIKYDGYRTLIVIDQGKVRAYSRPGRDWTGSYRRVVNACAGLACKSALIDGEVVVQAEQGISDFEALRSTKRRTASCSLPSISCTSMARICGEPLSLRGERHCAS